MFGGKKSRFDQIKKLYPGAHIESCKHPRKSFEYCSKEETRIGPNHQFGKPPVLRNNKQDIAAFNQQIIDIGPERAVQDGLIKIGDYKRFKISVELYKSSTRILEPIDSLEHEWVWGDPGVGKSKYARKQGAFFNKPANKWWDGYADQDVVVIDDFELEQKCLGHYLKIWADHYPFNAEIKNGSVTIRPKKIIVTSNYNPVQIWEGDNQMVKAIQRRFKFT